jgi:predicted ATPase/DNA-binding NarL/FixJ family response regulator
MPEVNRRGPAQLPHELSSFAGRRAAVEAIKQALSTSRLVTLTGPAGIGKSRLALRVARDLRQAFRGGVYLADLAGVRDTGSVAGTVATALGLDCAARRDPETLLVDYLKGRHALVVLDNCEHVRGTCCRQAEELLAGAEDLCLLVTSQTPLAARAEQVWPVPPLSVPDTEDLHSRRSQQQHEAVVLFEQRVAAVARGFTLDRDNWTSVARLCRRLDGNPLAIELAALQMTALSVDQILDRLDNPFRLLTTGYSTARPSHRTLLASQDRSFELCSPVERALWARCSVFTGDFDLDAVESVCAGGEIAEKDVLTSVAGLLDMSVLTRSYDGETARYRMLEITRLYGRQRLAEAGEEVTLRRRHRDYYLRLAEQADGRSGGAGQVELAHRLRADQDNFLAALDYCVTEPGDARAGLRMAAALWFLWIGCGLLAEGQSRLDRALAADTEPSPDRVRALWVAGWIAYLRGDPRASLVRHTEGHDLAQLVRCAPGSPFFYEETLCAGRLRHALARMDQRLAACDEPDRWAAPALLTLCLGVPFADLPCGTGKMREFFGECQARCVPVGERWVLSWAEWNVGLTWWAEGEPNRAGDCGRAALREKRDLQDRLGIVCCLELLSWVAASTGNSRRAAVLAGAADTLWKPIGKPLFGSEILAKWSGESRSRSREALRCRTYDAAYQEGACTPADEAIAYALAEPRPAVLAGSRPGAAGTNPVLTKREWEVAELVAFGLTDKAIAARLVISQRTAEGHVQNVLRKLDFTSRAQIVIWVLEQREGANSTG